MDTTPPELSAAARRNRAAWDAESDAYQTLHDAQLSDPNRGWGVWNLPESELRVLGDVAGKDSLELGCGGAQWSIWLAQQGARPVGLDNSGRQLEHARRFMARAGVDFPLVHSSAEQVPLPDASFDIVFCDHGAMTFADPYRTVPECARLLRPGGLLAFNMASPIHWICWDDALDRTTDRLNGNYFELYRDETGSHVEYQLPYGGWIRLLRQHGFTVEDLIEPRPPETATTTYRDYTALDWARRWPSETIWKARKVG